MKETYIGAVGNLPCLFCGWSSRWEAEDLQNFRPPKVVVLFCIRKNCHSGGECLFMYYACG